MVEDKSLTEHNISKFFDYFCKNVVKNGNKMNVQELVEIFFGIISDNENYHLAKPNTLVYGDKNISIDGKNLKSFLNSFEHNHSSSDIIHLKSIADRLIEDADRRNSGDFWTPTLFVDKAQEMISNALGEDWKEKYVVWDPAWGTGNLTRDYKFKNLYCSTLYQSELNIGAEYNPEASKFQFDFLNDEITSKDSIFGIYNDKLPKGLKDALMENKPIVFFLNPPYAQASNGKTDSGSKKGVAKTMINKIMLDNKIGSPSQNLYAQFLYRILLIKKEFNLTNCHIALFSPARFLSGSSFKKFREAFLNDFAFDDGILFNASNFDDCSDKWGISFSIWHKGKSADKNSFKYTLVENKDGEVTKCGDKTVYNTDGKVSASDWAKESIKKLKTFDCPNLTSCINVKEKNTRGKLFNNALGYFYNSGNNVDQNTQSVGIFSSAFGNGHGHGINESNFARCMALLSARKLIMTNWIQNTDEYLAPNESNEHYDEFVNDSIIYSLFQSKSNQSSLRNIDYKGKKWDIKNEFFWMSKKTIEDLANENHLSYTYNDARTSNERYVYNILNMITLSPEAQKVLDKANEIVVNTFKYREMFNEEHPEYQILNWDCGWAQIKAMAKEYDKEEFDEFKKIFKDLENKMRPMVYELGFSI